MTVLRIPSNDAAAAFPGAPPARYEDLQELGDVYASASQIELASECYRRAAVAAPHRAGPYVGLGLLAMQSDRLDDALRAFQIALRNEPDCAEARGGLAMVLQRTGRYAEAFDMYLQCLQLDGDNLVALLGLFQTSCQMGTFENIIHYLEVYLDKHPADTAVLFCLATLYAREGWLADAREALEPDQTEAEELLRRVTQRMGELQPQGTAAP